MNNSTCGCRWSCVLLSVFASVAIGIVTTLLTITGTVAVTPAFLWVLFGIAVVYLAVTFAVLSAQRTRCDGCICRALPALLTGILGTVVTSVVLLAITFAATSIIGAIFTGLLLLFFSLIISTTACLIRCAASCENNN